MPPEKLLDSTLLLSIILASGVTEQCSQLRGFRRGLFERSELRSRPSWRTYQGTQVKNCKHNIGACT